ncbi:hypothetical protein M0R04_08450 [Candidatus Dojkabacteria bacterium]|jgi:hypothetical protein|nr:hypothetical protein [Candidatus Dojkabacteria bacterium]
MKRKLFNPNPTFYDYYGRNPTIEEALLFQRKLGEYKRKPLSPKLLDYMIELAENSILTDEEYEERHQSRVDFK